MVCTSFYLLKIIYGLRHLTAGSSINFSCFACHEKTLLRNEISDLRITITKMQERISALQTIRNLENEIDDFDRTLNIESGLCSHGNDKSFHSTNPSVEDLTDLFASFTLSSDVPLPTHNITIEGSINQTVGSTNNQSCITSIWSSDSNQSHLSDDILLSSSVSSSSTCDSISQVPLVNVSGNSVTNGNSMEADYNTFPKVTDFQINASISHPNATDLQSETITQPTRTVNGTNPSGSSIQAAFEKEDLNVSCVFVGDSTIRKVSPFLAESKHKCYKVSYPHASAASIHKTLSYLLKSRHKLAKTILLQVGNNDIYNRLTEEVKTDFKLLSEDLCTSGRRLVISGPVPPCQLNGEQFTRTLQLHEWLKDWAKTEQHYFINNFDLFWQKKHLFTRNGKVLNDLGSMVLTYNIRTNFPSPPTL